MNSQAQESTANTDFLEKASKTDDKNNLDNDEFEVCHQFELESGQLSWTRQIMCI